MANLHQLLSGIGGIVAALVVSIACGASVVVWLVRGKSTPTKTTRV